MGAGCQNSNSNFLLVKIDIHMKKILPHSSCNSINTEDINPIQPSYSGLFSLGSSIFNQLHDRA